MRIVQRIVGLALTVAGCGAPSSPVDSAAEGSEGDPLPDPPASATRVRFELGDGGPLPLGAVPFPSELYRDADGRIELGAWPNPRSADPLFDGVRGLLAERGGFCGTCGIHFVIDGGLDASSIPTSASAGQAAALDDAIVVVDLEPGTPSHGQAIPLRVQWHPEGATLAVRPARGHVLAAGHRHAAILTSAIRGADGLPLAAAPTLAAILDDDRSDARVAAAADAFAPALAALDALDLPRADIAGLAVFTPEDPTVDLLAARAAIHDAAAPSITVDATWSGAALDGLLGVPIDDRPGIDTPPQVGTDGTAAIAHRTTAMVIAGRFTAPRFVGGSGGEIGALVRGDDGRLRSSHSDAVPFVLIIPADVDLTRLPVVISHHGFNASRTTGFALADTAGAAGFAVLAIDAFQHGERAPSARDELHAMRGGLDGPDGFAETTVLDVSAHVFGLSGAPPGMTLFPGYPLGAFLQFAADGMSAVRLVRSSDLAPLRAVDPSLGALAFDPERIAFVGNSMGAVVGTAIAVVEPDVGAFVLDVMPGSIVETLVESAEFRPLSELLLLPQIGVDREFAEPDDAMVFDPTIELWRWALQPIDPLALAPHLVHQRVIPGTPPDLLIQLAAQDEVAAPPASESVVAAARIGGAGTFEFAAIATQPLPVRGNLDGATVAAVRFEAAMHGMLEVSRQSSSWQPPLLPPLVERDAALAIDNPIVAVHAQIEGFLRSFAEDGHATITE